MKLVFFILIEYIVIRTVFMVYFLADDLPLPHRVHYEIPNSCYSTFDTFSTFQHGMHFDTPMTFILLHPTLPLRGKNVY